MIANTTRSQCFGRTVKYVLGKSDAQLIYTNVFAGLTMEASPEDIAKEMSSTASRNRTKQPVYHISVSPAEADRLEITDWFNLSQDLLRKLGLEKNQVVVGLHNDEHFPSGKPRPHAHLVINLVDDSGKLANTSWDYRKTERVLRELESAYGLTSIQSSWECQHRRPTSGQLERVEPESLSHTAVGETQEGLPLYSEKTLPATPTEQEARGRGAGSKGEEAQGQGAGGRGEEAGGQGAGGWGASLPPAPKLPAPLPLVEPSKRSQAEKEKVNNISGSGSSRASADTETLSSKQELLMSNTESDKEPKLYDNSRYKTVGDILAAARQQDSQQYVNNSPLTNSNQATPRTTFVVGKELERFGQLVQRSGSQELDGTHLAGASISLLGSVAKLADAFHEALARAKEQAEKERVNRIIDDLEAVGERTAKLEENIRTNGLASELPQGESEKILETQGRRREQVNQERVNKIINDLEAVGERTAKLETVFEKDSVAPKQSASEPKMPSPSFSESEKIPDFWAEVDSDAEQPSFKAIADKLLATENLEGLKQVKEEYGLNATTAAWNTLSYNEPTQNERDPITPKIIHDANKYPQKDLAVLSEVFPSSSSERDRLTELAQSQGATTEARGQGAGGRGNSFSPPLPAQSSPASSLPPAPKLPAPLPLPENPLADATELSSERINRLEQLIGGNSDSKSEQIKIDRTASFDKQLDQISAAISQLNSRLDKLETVLSSFQANKVEPSFIADSLVSYTRARAEVYGLDPEAPIPTKSMGAITVSEQGNYVVIKDEKQGIKFSATMLGGEWEVTTNELSSDEAKRLISLPKTPSDYQLQANGKDLVGYLQRHVTEQFSGSQQGIIHWQDKNSEFSYKFTIDLAANGERIIKGVDSSSIREVFSATIQTNGVIETSKSEIPTERIDGLLQQEQRNNQQLKLQQQQRQTAAARTEQELAL